MTPPKGVNQAPPLKMRFFVFEDREFYFFAQFIIWMGGTPDLSLRGVILKICKKPGFNICSKPLSAISPNSKKSMYDKKR